MTSRRSLALLSLFLLAAMTACSGAANQSAGRCLYVLDLEFGRDTKWGSCKSPPACAIERITGDNPGRVGPGC